MVGMKGLTAGRANLTSWSFQREVVAVMLLGRVLRTSER